jgi:quinone-modifying oxidoreductase subunit QmoA
MSILLRVKDIIPEEDGGVTVVAENAVTGEKVQEKVDMAILATGMAPAIQAEGASLGVQMDNNGFVLSDEGMIAAGCAKKAADVVTSNQSATAAALKAIQASRR